MKNDFFAFAQNKYIYIPFILWFGIQLFKLIWDLATTKKFNFKRLMGAGRIWLSWLGLHNNASPNLRL